MKRMSFSETIFLFLLALIIFGPKKLPEIARQLGKYMNEFKRASNEFKAQIEQEIANLDIEDRRRKILPPSPAPEGTASRTLNAVPSGQSQAATSPSPSGAADTSPGEAQAVEAAAEDEPLFARAPATATAATTAAASTEPPTVPAATNPASEAATTVPAQETHA